METIIRLNSIGDGYAMMRIEQDNVIVRIDSVRIQTIEDATVPKLVIEFLDCNQQIAIGSVRDALKRAEIGKHFYEV